MKVGDEKHDEPEKYEKSPHRRIIDKLPNSLRPASKGDECRRDLWLPLLVACDLKVYTY
jgi:hypothetical protein